MPLPAAGPASFWPPLMRVCLLVFLALSAVGAFAACSPPRPGRASSFTPLRLLFFAGFLAVFAYQAFWQIFGYTNPSFVRFERKYNRRANAAELQTARGPILDRRGLVLAAPVPGDVWGRRYPLGAAAAHPLGYFHSHYGITAVERVFDPRLSGYDADIDKKSLKEVLTTPRLKEGKPVNLTLDARLQKKAYELLAGRKGAVVAIVPATGRLLALVSSPAFDPQHPEEAMRDTVNTPAFNRAVQGLYPPGSTFKPVVAAAALDRGLDPVLNCPASGFVAGPHTPPIRDSEYYVCRRAGAVWKGWGSMGMHEAIVHSANTYFAQLGMRLGTLAFAGLGVKAQLGKPLVYLEGDTGTLKTQAGNFPENPHRRSLAQLCIGQGRLLVTPLHVACFTAAIANDGVMMQPRLDADAKPEACSRLCKASSARRVKAAMAEVVTRGTGKALNLPGLSVCGKTGTAQAAQGGDHAWFTCFAPKGKPAVAITVLVENAGFGAKAALPVARELLLECSASGLIK